MVALLRCAPDAWSVNFLWPLEHIATNLVSKAALLLLLLLSHFSRVRLCATP